MNIFKKKQTNGDQNFFLISKQFEENIIVLIGGATKLLQESFSHCILIKASLKFKGKILIFLRDFSVFSYFIQVFSPTSQPTLSIFFYWNYCII